MLQLAVELMSEVAQIAVPVAVVFELGNLVIQTVLRTAFGGRLWLAK